MKLKPRKRIDPAKIPRRGKPVPAFCAFCRARIPRAKKLPGPSRSDVGRCTSCDAIHVVDANGKLGGEALLEGLSQLADHDTDRAMSLREGTDYELRCLAYDEVRHEVDEVIEPSRYGIGRIWYFRDKREEQGAGNVGAH